MGNIIDRLSIAIASIPDIPENVELESVTFVFSGKEVAEIVDLYEERGTRLNDQWDRFREIESENADLNSQIDNQAYTIRSLQAQNDHLKAESADLKAAYAKLQFQWQCRNKEIDRRFESLREYGDLKETIADLKAENADLIFRISRILEALSDLPQGE